MLFVLNTFMVQPMLNFRVSSHVVNKLIIEVLLVRLKVMMSRLRVLVTMTMTMTRLLPRVVVVSRPIMSVFVVWDSFILHWIEGGLFMQH